MLAKSAFVPSDKATNAQIVLFNHRLGILPLITKLKNRLKWQKRKAKSQYQKDRKSTYRLLSLKDHTTTTICIEYQTQMLIDYKDFSSDVATSSKIQ